MNSKIELNQDTLSKYKELERKIEKYEKKRLIRSILFTLFPILLIIFLSLYLNEHQDTIQTYFKYEETLRILQTTSDSIKELKSELKNINGKKNQYEKDIEKLKDSLQVLGNNNQSQLVFFKDSLEKTINQLKKLKIEYEIKDSSLNDQITKLTDIANSFRLGKEKSDSINYSLQKINEEIEIKTELSQKLKIDSITIKRFDNKQLLIRFNLNGLENIKNSLISKNNKFTIDIKIFDIDNSEYIVPNEGTANGKGKQFVSKPFIISKNQNIKNAEIKYFNTDKQPFKLGKNIRVEFFVKGINTPLIQQNFRIES